VTDSTGGLSDKNRLAPWAIRNAGVRSSAVDPVDYNFAHSMAAFAATSKSGLVQQTRDAVLTTHNAPAADFNQCFLKTPTYKLARTLSRVDEFQARAGVPLRLHAVTEPENVGRALEAHGATQGDSVPAMTMDLTDFSSGKPPDALEILLASTPDDLAAVGRIAFAAFGYPVALAPIAFTEDLMALPHVELFLGKVAEEPACCSMLLRTGAVAGIYWVGVEDRFRNRGFGAAITRHAAIVGRQKGCELAALQASRMGEPVYQRIGFRTVRRYGRFDLPVR